MLEAAEKEEAHKINMQVRLATMSYDTVRLSIAGLPPKKRQKPTKMEVTIPILVNSKPLRQDDILVMEHRTVFDLDELEEGDGVENDGDEEAWATCT